MGSSACTYSHIFLAFSIVPPTWPFARQLEIATWPEVAPQGFVIIPKSVSPKRIKSNAEIFDFEISPEDMKEVRTTPSSARKPWTVEADSSFAARRAGRIPRECRTSSSRRSYSWGAQVTDWDVVDVE
jgi:hypothetical protein